MASKEPDVSSDLSTAWVVGEADDALVLGPTHDLLRLALLHDALASASTWGDLREKLGVLPGLLEEVESRTGDAPDDSTLFREDDVPGYYQGEWPALPTERMAGWLPDAVLGLGSFVPTLFGPELLLIKPDRRSEVVARMERLGHKCRSDDDLIARACGAQRYC